LAFEPREILFYWEDIAMQTKYFRHIARKAWLLIAIGGVFLIGPAQTVQAQQPAACPPGQECPCTWTSWLDRDDPSGVGDFEDLVNLVGKACKQPTAIQCRDKKTQKLWGWQTLPLIAVNNAGPGYSCMAAGPAAGGICQNTKTKPPGTQDKPTCMDSEVRFCCAKDG
jgi:hypothetical protein